MLNRSVLHRPRCTNAAKVSEYKQRAVRTNVRARVFVVNKRVPLYFVSQMNIDERVTRSAHIPFCEFARAERQLGFPLD